MTNEDHSLLYELLVNHCSRVAGGVPVEVLHVPHIHLDPVEGEVVDDTILDVWRHKNVSITIHEIDHSEHATLVPHAN